MRFSELLRNEYLMGTYSEDLYKVVVMSCMKALVGGIPGKQRKDIMKFMCLGGHGV